MDIKNLLYAIILILIIWLLISFTLLAKIFITLFVLFVFIGNFVYMQIKNKENDYNELFEINDFIKDISEPMEKTVIRTVEPDEIIEKHVFKPFVLPDMFNRFSSSSIRLDSEKYIQNVVSEIIQFYTQYNISLNFVEADKTAQFNVLKFRILKTFRLVKGKEIAVEARIADIKKCLPDLKRNLGMENIGFIDFISGTKFIGFSIPCSQNNIVKFGNVLSDFDKYIEYNKNSIPNNLPVCLGVYPQGNLFIDIVTAPHLLIAGKSGSGKSVQLNTTLVSLLSTHTNDSLQFYMADGKTELHRFTGIPHLNKRPVVREVEEFIEMLDEVLEICEEREELLINKGLRDIQSYNEKTKEFLPYIVVIVDEYGDFMLLGMKMKIDGMKVTDLIEQKLARLAQKGRSSGIHLILTTQRPSADVVTGLIKANLGTKIALTTNSEVDSRIIIDSPDASALNGNGDAILRNDDGLTRFQGLYIEDKELVNFVNEIKDSY